MDTEKLYTVTLHLEHCTAQNPGNTVQHGSTYTNILVPESGYYFNGASGFVTGDILDCSIIMGATNIQDLVFNPNNGEVEIENVNGNITIAVYAEEDKPPEQEGRE